MAGQINHEPKNHPLPRAGFAGRSFINHQVSKAQSDFIVASSLRLDRIRPQAEPNTRRSKLGVFVSWWFKIRVRPWLADVKFFGNCQISGHDGAVPAENSAASKGFLPDTLRGVPKASRFGSKSFHFMDSSSCFDSKSL
jgi:hypothetical protein